MQKITKIILRVLSIVIGLPVVAVLLIAALVGVQYLRNDHPIALPAPSGSHPVGRVLLDLRDSARQRELMVFVWYPAESGFAGPPPEYVPGHWGELEAAQMLPIPAMRLRQIRVNSVENAPLLRIT